MCIHEQLETLHDTMSAHMKTYKMWMSSKTILRFWLFLCSSSKQDPKRKKEKKEIIWRSSVSVIPLFFKELNFEYITLYKLLHRTQETKPSLPFCLVDFDTPPTPAGWKQKKQTKKKISLCWMVTLGSLEQLAWYFPAGLCFPGSGTGLGLCTYPLEWSRRRQSSARLLAPEGPGKKNMTRRRFREKQRYKDVT